MTKNSTKLVESGATCPLVSPSRRGRILAYQGSLEKAQGRLCGGT